MHIPETPRRYLQILVLLRASSPGVFYLTVLAHLVIALVPGALIYLGAQLIERVSKGQTLASVLFILIAYVLLSGFEEAVQALSRFMLDTLRERLRMKVKRDINHFISNYPDMGIHEDPALRETAILASRSADQLTEFVTHAFIVEFGAVTLIPVLILTGHIAWWIPCVTVLGLAPLIQVRTKAERRSWDVQSYHASTFNILRIFERILTQPEYAKDLRMYRMRKGLLERWTRHYARYLHDVIAARKRNGWAVILTSLFSGFVLILPSCVIVKWYTKQIIGISDLTMFITSVLQLRVGLTAIIYSYGDMLGTSYAIQPYRQLIDHPGSPSADYPSLPAHSPIRLRIDQLHFQYRDANTAALNKINLSVQSGETIAVVGENGSGKSTLIKLICGFYPPTAGSIQWNISGRKPRIVGVFQDFARFPLNTLDNMASEERARAKETLHLIGLDFLQSMLNKPLTAEIEGGMALSGGQWQRLAIARAMMHVEEADLLVFDEPTSSLDPEAERQLMQVIMALTAHRSALIVSHRLALARFADRIIVMDAGQIIEEGAHGTLMKQAGKYYQMFRSQADLYL